MLIPKIFGRRVQMEVMGVVMYVSARWFSAKTHWTGYTFLIKNFTGRYKHLIKVCQWTKAEAMGVEMGVAMDFEQ